jgi:hypothetical protein
VQTGQNIAIQRLTLRIVAGGQNLANLFINQRLVR